VEYKLDYTRLGLEEAKRRSRTSTRRAPPTVFVARTVTLFQTIHGQTWQLAGTRLSHHSPGITLALCPPHLERYFSYFWRYSYLRRFCSHRSLLLLSVESSHGMVWNPASFKPGTLIKFRRDEDMMGDLAETEFKVSSVLGKGRNIVYKCLSDLPVLATPPLEPSPSLDATSPLPASTSSHHGSSPSLKRKPDTTSHG
jgi:hypothetical protein